MHYIRYDTLYEYVLSRIKYWASVAQNDENTLLEKLINSSDKKSCSFKKKGCIRFEESREASERIRLAVYQAV